MKKILFICFAILSVNACSKDTKDVVPTTEVSNDVSFKSLFADEEYANATPFERKVMAHIDAATVSMEARARIEPDADLETIVSVSLSQEESMSMLIVIDRNKSVKDKLASILVKSNTSDRSCRICAGFGIVGDVRDCVKQIVEDMEDQVEFDVHVKREGSRCVTLSW